MKRWYSILNGTYNSKQVPVQTLDPFSKWLVATRSVVFVMTANSVLIAFLLAIISYGFKLDFLPLVAILVLGLTISHAASNLFNDYYDAKHGIDTSNDYFRPQYLPHPSISGMMSQKSLFFSASIHLAIMLSVASYFFILRGPLVLLFTFLGAISMLLYAGGPKPFKRIGMGEIVVFIVWGPLMIGGSYFVLTGSLPAWVILASVPYGVSVSTVLFGKHIDKIEYDKQIGVKTLPVIIGEKNTKIIIKGMIFFAYSSVCFLVLIKTLPVFTLLSFLALPKAKSLFEFLSRPRPKEPPQGYSIWPIWYLGAVFSHNRRYGSLLLLGLIFSSLVPVYI